MTTSLLRWIGIDPGQFRALTRTYLKMDLRKGGGAHPAHGSKRASLSGNPYAALVVASLVNSIAAALLVFVLRDTLTAAVALITLAAMNTAMLVLIDFGSFVVAAEDYWIIAPRPVSSRTYFAARSAAVLVYIAIAAAIIATFPALVFLVRHDTGLGGAAGAIAATIMSCIATSCTVIAAYTTLIGHIHPKRLARAMTLLQVLSSGVSLGIFYIAVEATEQTALRQISIREIDWTWLLPPTWFAALVPMTSGSATITEWIAGSAAVVVTAGTLLIASGRLSLEFAERLAEATTVGEPPRRRAGWRIPGFRGAEAYAVATLIRAQFRYDTRFRLAVLSILPLTLFYLLLGLEEGALQDPFAVRGHGAAPIYVAISFLPLTLHASIRYSDHWRASWVFFAAPADPARLVVSAKNFVALFFLGGYTLALAVVWSFFYERVWHAILHALVVGAGAHMLLQGAVLFSPTLPFATEPRRMEQGGRLILLFFLASMGAGVAPALLPIIYGRRSWTLALLVSLAAATAAMETAVRRRARRTVGALEFN